MNVPKGKIKFGRYECAKISRKICEYTPIVAARNIFLLYNSNGSSIIPTNMEWVKKLRSVSSGDKSSIKPGITFGRIHC